MMALLCCHNSFLCNPVCWELVADYFDTIEVAARDRRYDTTTLRVFNDEVPAEDVEIELTAMEIPGIKPFVTGFKMIFRDNA